MPSKMKYLITGGNGFLGKSLKETSEKKDLTIYSLGLSNANDIICDLRTNIPTIPKDVNIVIHAAGKAHTIAKTKAQEEDFFNINVNGTLNLLKGIEKSNLKNNIRQFIFISTVAVYGLDYGTNINEGYSLLGKTPYAQSKIEAETLLKKWGLENKINVIILRLPLLVGNNPKGNLGRMISAIKKSYYVKIDFPPVKKSMVLVDDISNFIFSMKKSSGIYNLTDGRHPNISEIENIICNHFNKKIYIKLPFFFMLFVSKICDAFGVNYFNSNILNKMSKSLTFDDSKASQELGWSPKSVIEHFLKN
jgi:nucleoside-diphosphate-sugar epimerase